MSGDGDTAQAEETATKPGLRALGLSYGLPILLFAIIAGAMGYGLYFLDPRSLPSAMIDEPVPRFELPPLPGSRHGLSSEDLSGHVALVNVFASWCAPCRIEHPLFMEIARSHGEELKIYGIAYKDKPDDTLAWLKRLGDPYNAVGMDQSGRVAIDFGVYGVPETYLIRPDGTIAYRHVGVLSEQDWNRTLAPMVKALTRQSPRGGS